MVSIGGGYWINEKYDDEYINYHYNVDKDNVIIVKDSVVEAGEEKDLELYYEMLDFCTMNDLSDDANIDRVFNEYLDRDSTIDYYAVELYISRSLDWPGGNWAMWRSRSIDTDEYSDGKWRWMLFDVNYGALDTFSPDYDPIAFALDDPLFASLMSNERFKTDLLNRISELKDTVFSTERVDNSLNNYHHIMDEQIQINAVRFFGDKGIEFSETPASGLEYFLHHRAEYIDKIINIYR